eukprot:Lithocolla_globosa_v1_NODE_6081_length_1139_cov_5.972325.p2 type:complete len:121 gc:universal NODE_6081_length_1139_cov_5.972325:662-1024(+)
MNLVCLQEDVGTLLGRLWLNGSCKSTSSLIFFVLINCAWKAIRCFLTTNSPLCGAPRITRIDAGIKPPSWKSLRVSSELSICLRRRKNQPQMQISKSLRQNIFYEDFDCNNGTPLKSWQL